MGVFKICLSRSNTTFMDFKEERFSNLSTEKRKRKRELGFLKQNYSIIVEGKNKKKLFVERQYFEPET